MSAAAPGEAPVVRRGRGTFSQALRSSAPTPPAGAAALATAGSQDSVTDRFAFAFQQPAKDIDISGATEMVEAETVRVQLFRRERRRRQIVIVGDVPAVLQRGTCKLFGFRGIKPQRLQQKFIRMVHLALPPAEVGDVRDELVCGDALGGARTTAAASSLSECGAHPSVAQPEPSEGTLDVEQGCTTTTTTKRAAITNETTAISAPPAQETTTDDTGARTEAAAPTSTSSIAAAAEKRHYGVLPFCVAIDGDAGESGARGDSQSPPGSLTTPASSPILAAPRLASLASYLHDEFTTLWKFEDVAKQKVQIRLEFGAAFVCSNSSYHRNMEGDLSVPSLLEKLGDESLQLHFLGDCPACVTRAVEHVCRPLQTASRSYSSVKLTFFSADRQTRTVAHALWNGVQNGFELTDVEGVGLSFLWTVFSLAGGERDADEVVGVAEAATATTDTTVAGAPAENDATAPAAKGDQSSAPTENVGGDGGTVTGRVMSSRKPAGRKTIAYPFSVSFRAFHKSRRTAEHGAYASARAVLDKLTETEHTILEHGSASHYESMDLSSIRDMNVRSQDFKLESIQVDHVDQRKLKGELIVESASSLLIEGFLTQDGRVASQRFGGGGGDGREDERQQSRDGLSYYRTRTNSVHWKIQNEVTGGSLEANVAPLHTAMSFVDAVLARANSTGAKEQRVGRAPEAL